MKTAIYRWSGEYFGFISNNKLFDKESTYLGWIDSKKDVWRKDGTYLGEIINSNYILKKRSMATRSKRAIRATPAKPAAIASRAARASRAIRAGYTDALDEF